MEKEKGGFLNLTKVHEEEDMRVFRLQVAELKKMEKVVMMKLILCYSVI